MKDPVCGIVFHYRIKKVKVESLSYEAGAKDRGRASINVSVSDREALSIMFVNISPNWIKKQLGIFEKKPEPVSMPEEGPFIALVIDDFGYAKRNFKTLEEIRSRFTMAVLPNTPYADEACAFAETNGLETILHLPMEPENTREALEKDTIKTDMDRKTVTRILADDLRSVYAARGVSNHMGSRATCDMSLMTTLMQELRKKDLFFLDSFTSAGSICEKAAQTAGVDYLRRDIFIDNRLDSEYIKNQLKKLEKIARAKGDAIGIGHDRSLTIDVLREVMDGMEKSGIRFVTLSELVQIRKGKEAK